MASRQAKETRERADLSRVFQALCDPESLEDDGLRFLDLEHRCTRAEVPRGNLKGTLRTLDVCLEPGAPYFIGGSGIVIRCCRAGAAEVKYAVKIPRPSLYERGEEDAWRIYRGQQAEVLKHLPLAHENIARVLQPGELAVGPLNLPVLLMEWIPGARPLTTALMRSNHRIDSVVRMVVQCLEALQYLHGRGLIHWDVKADNLLVSDGGTVKLTDVGNAIEVSHPDAVRYTTYGKFPELLMPHVVAQSEALDDSKRVKIVLSDRTWDTPWLDLWMLAGELNWVFQAIATPTEATTESDPEFGRMREQFLSTMFPRDDDHAQFSLSYIRRIIQRLLRPATPTVARYYEAAEEVASHFRHLLTEFGGAQSVAELQAIPQRVLRLPQSGNLAWTTRLSEVFNLPTIRRLSIHRQLGTVVQVYPGASHTRFEHTAGVVSHAAAYVRALYGDRTEPFWRLEVTATDVEALLLAAVLHDCGHVAFGHFLEEMGGLFKGRTHEDYVLLVADPKRAGQDRGYLREYGPIRFADPSASRRTALEDRYLLKEVLLDSWGVGDRGLDPLLCEVGMILRPPKSSAVRDVHSRFLREESAQLKIEILHSVMDSALDVDKLDYLLRDAHHCGVPYPEGIDIERLLQSLTTVPHLPNAPGRGGTEMPSGHQAAVGVSNKGVLPVESALIARYQMFACVYWHHTTRAHTAMFQHLVLKYLECDSASECESRLDQLLDTFRLATDTEALLWLRTKLVELYDVTPVIATRLRGAVACLLGEDREQLYRRAFELRYERGGAGPAQGMVSGLSGMVDEANEVEEPLEYVRGRRRMRDAFSSSFVSFLAAKYGTTVMEGVGPVEDGDILIDIPPGGKDQVEDIYVVGPDKVRTVQQVSSDAVAPDKVRTIQQVSSVADAVSDAFKYWVRKLRVFLAPRLWDRLRGAGIEERDVAAACWQALERQAITQLELTGMDA